MTTTLIEAGDLTAQPGSREWAIAVRLEIHACLRDRESSVQNARAWIRMMEEHNGFSSLEDAKGKSFRSFADFCKAKPPYGLGYDPDVVERIKSEERERSIADVVSEAKARPLLDNPGPRTKEEKSIVSNRNNAPTKGGTNTDYLSRRLARDAPEILDKLASGELRSVRAAAIEAGIVKPDTPLQKLKRAWKAASAAERLAFTDWTEDQEGAPQ